MSQPVLPPDDMEYGQYVLSDSKLQFEKRILNPSQYPVLTNEDGTISTHEMAWGEMDGKYIAYPTVVQLPNGKLQRLPDEIADFYARENKEYRTFDTPQDAENYSRGGYKFQWGALEPKEQK